MQPQKRNAVYNTLYQRIVTGKYPCGSKLPGELKLIREFGVCRETLRGAMALLEANRLLRRMMQEAADQAGIPLYLNKEGSGDNITNHMLWNMMIGAPLVAILASAVGYLATAQALLARLETSVAIWFLLLVVYHVIRRWMLIQRRRLAFDRAKHRRAEMLAQRARGEEEAHHHSSPEGAIEVDESEVDLDAISAQSLRLVRSILMLIALLSVIVLWSEIHSAFGFLENISFNGLPFFVDGI